MNIGYRVHTSLRKEVSRPLTDEEVLIRFGNFAHSTDGPDFIVHDDGTRGAPRPERDIRVRLGALVSRLESGQKLRVVSDDGHRFVVHAVELDPPLADVPGVPAVKAWVAVLRQRWPNARLAGTCVCKDDSTGKCNGHNDCAACDDFDTIEHMRQQRDWQIENAEEIGLSYNILEDDIWTFGPPRTFSSRGSRFYPGEYHHHLHSSFIGGICSIACREASQWP